MVNAAGLILGAIVRYMVNAAGLILGAIVRYMVNTAGLILGATEIFLQVIMMYGNKTLRLPFYCLSYIA